MYARLWWKDARQFWPIWIFLVLVAAVVQIAVLMFSGAGARNIPFDGLGAMAMGWTCLYAIAVGAAAFAGEREAGTLRLLDIIPISRSIVWAGKVSFGVVTTLAMALVLLIVALLGAASSPEYYAASFEPTSQLSTRVGTLFIVVFVALGWGFLCSAMFKNAITAAVAAIVCAGLSWSSAMRGLETYFYQDVFVPTSWLAAANVGLIVVTIAISYAVFTRSWKFGGVPIEFRSPFVVRSPIELRSPFGGLETTTAERAPTTVLSTMGSAIRGTVSETPFIPGKRSRLAEARVLVWQTMREGRGIWLLLAPISVVLPWTIAGMIEPMWFVITNIAVALTAGISVFGIENRGNTQRFLVHHGARAGLVWAVKLGVWIVGLSVIWGMLYVTWNAFSVRSVPTVPRPEILHVQRVAIILFAGGIFAVAQLCGMAIRRGITAWVLGLVAALLLVGSAGALVAANILRPWTAVLIVPAFLLISWLWSGDWLFDRPAPGRWLRLGLISGVVATALFGGFIAERAWGVPDSPAIAAPQVWAKLADIDTTSDRDAAPLYRETTRLFQKMGKSIVMVVDGSMGQEIRTTMPTTGADPVDLERIRSQTLSAIHEAAERPECRFLDPAKLSFNASLNIPPMTDLTVVVSEEFRRLMVSGDLTGAWKEVKVLFQMARHTSELAILGPSQFAFEIEYTALPLAREWALDERQTPERLHDAIVSYPNWPARISRDQVVQGEARWIERNIAQITDDDILQLERPSYRDDQAPSIRTALWARLITPPWERERARRIARLGFAELLRLSILEPFQSTADKDIHGSEPFQLATDNYPYTRYQSSSPLLGRVFRYWTMQSYFMQDAKSLVERRALVQIMAIREWQIRHDGQFPAKLEELVPAVLPALPVDPYSGKPFRYVEWTPMTKSEHDQRSLAGGPGFIPSDRPAGTHILYSIGPDRKDDRGRQPLIAADQGDILFDIPPIAPKAKASADGAQGSSKPVVDKPVGARPKP